MKVTARTRLRMRLQNWLFVAAFLAALGTLGWLSTQYAFEADWTAGQRNTLTDASRTLVSSLEEPVRVTAFVRGGEVQRRPIEELLARYQRHTDWIELEFVDPELDPARTRAAGVAGDGELVVEYFGRTERVQQPNERSLSTALQRLTRTDERWVAHLEGHGERSAHGDANHDYGSFTAELQRQGLRVRSVNPLAREGIPDNTSLLVVAGPQVELLPGTVDALISWVERGGNLLWLADPGPMYGLEALAEHLDLALSDGAVLDATAQMFGINDPRMVIVAEYGAHAVTRDFSIVTLFPHAAAIQLEAATEAWRVEPLLTTLPHTVLDTDDATQGPFDIGVTLTRLHEGSEQRIAVLGDGDFATNAYLGNAGNLEFGLNLFNWLVRDDEQINVHLRSAPDLTLSLPRTAFIAISFAFLLGLPLALVAAGVSIWLRRRRR